MDNFIFAATLVLYQPLHTVGFVFFDLDGVCRGSPKGMYLFVALWMMLAIPLTPQPVRDSDWLS